MAPDRLSRSTARTRHRRSVARCRPSPRTRRGPAGTSQASRVRIRQAPERGSTNSPDRDHDHGHRDRHRDLGPTRRRPGLQEQQDAVEQAMAERAERGRSRRRSGLSTSSQAISAVIVPGREPVSDASADARSRTTTEFASASHATDCRISDRSGVARPPANTNVAARPSTNPTADDRQGRPPAPPGSVPGTAPSASGR